GAGLYRSRDGGRTFTRLGGPEWGQRTVNDLFWWKASLFAATGEGLFLSHDAGETWKSASAELEGTKVLAISIPAAEADLGSDILVGTESGVFKSSDGALSWRQVTVGMGKVEVVGFGSFPMPPQNLRRPGR
ncbi:MAG: WD40/YVTN/BNR-like repeat-containing protein, partial [Acidobacteriota bacterium]